MIDPRPDGTVLLDLEDGQEPIRLRRPKYGEYKRIQLGLAGVQESTTGPRSALEAIPEDKDVSAEDRPTVDAQRREAADALSKASEEALVAWWTDVVAVLGSRPLPESVDDWPIEMILDGNSISGLATHWRTVPLDRGAMGHPTPSS